MHLSMCLALVLHVLPIRPIYVNRGYMLRLLCGYGRGYVF